MNSEMYKNKCEQKTAAETTAADDDEVEDWCILG